MVKKSAVFQRVFWSLLLCASLSGSAFAAMSDSDFIRLCGNGSFQQIDDAIKNGANVNAKSASGWTPLITTIASRNPRA